MIRGAPMKKAIVFGAALVCIIVLPRGGSSFTGARPGLPRGVVVERADVPVADPAPGVLGQTYWGTNIKVERFGFSPEAVMKRVTFDGDRILYVLDGSCTVSGGTVSAGLAVHACIYLRGEMDCRIDAGDTGADILEVSWPVDPDTDAARPVTAAPSVPEGTAFDRNDIQFSQPLENIDAQVMTTRYGQFVFMRMMPDADIARDTQPGERLVIVTRGDMDVDVDGTTGRMTLGDILYLDGSTAFSAKTGPDGCDAVAVFSPGSRTYAEAHERRMAAFAAVFDPGTEPRLLVDGENDPPGLTFTEGPSWMNGAFYFSNYYKYWKPFGSSDEGGVWVVNRDGSFRVLNKNVQTCGTTPLANGNLAVCDLIDIGIREMTPDGVMGRVIVDSFEGKPFGTVNDLVTDRKGGLYFTDSSKRKQEPCQPGTALYYLAKDGTLTRVTEPDAVDYINGVALTPDDKTLFLNGSGEEYVWAFDVAADGSLSNKRPFARLMLPDDQLGRGRRRSIADGMTIDREGRLCVATPLGIQVFDPDGGYLGAIRFPKAPSHCVFGGDDYSWLYVTARTHVYSIRTKMTGFQYPLEPLK